MISALVTSAYPRTSSEKRPSFSAAIVNLYISAIVLETEKTVIVIFTAVCIFTYNISASFVYRRHSAATDSTSAAVATEAKIAAEIDHLFPAEVDLADRFAPIGVLHRRGEAAGQGSHADQEAVVQAPGPATAPEDDPDFALAARATRRGHSTAATTTTRSTTKAIRTVSSAAAVDAGL